MNMTDTDRAPWIRSTRQMPRDLDEPEEMLPGAPVASFDMNKIETALTRNPLDEIAAVVRALTYGEMIELASSLWKLQPADKGLTAETLPGMLHQWSTENRA